MDSLVSSSYSSEFFDSLSVQQQVEFAVMHQRKISVQSVQSDPFTFEIIHPYAITLDVFGGQCVVGIAERAGTDTPLSFAKLRLEDIRFIELLEINFEPDSKLWLQIQG